MRWREHIKIAHFSDEFMRSKVVVIVFAHTTTRYLDEVLMRKNITMYIIYNIGRLVDSNRYVHVFPIQGAPSQFLS